VQEHHTSDDNFTIVDEFTDSIQLQIFREIDNLSNLHTAAQIEKGFYETYQIHKSMLMCNIYHVDRLGSDFVGITQHGGNYEDKMFKYEPEKIKQEEPTAILQLPFSLPQQGRYQRRSACNTASLTTSQKSTPDTSKYMPTNNPEKSFTFRSQGRVTIEIYLHGLNLIDYVN
jgi:hypothetical protein